ncbi:alpha-E domain-containing protein [Kamptonema cortianum]|nr:alpha-E domain-containing protein [Geitlerinema splendidum]MDK3157080.1 alpha-E domain-containing protein [Kamptonema cortianum]
MLLSRVANSLYWMGRYLERAENVNRHLVVASEFAVELEGIEEDIAKKEWQSLVASLPHSGTEEIPEDPEDSLNYILSFLIDKENQHSVISALGKARDNARSVSETITYEITYNLNEAYAKLESLRKKKVADPGVAVEIASNTHNSLLTTLGAIEHTLTRGEGWNYMKLGEALERTQRTLFALKTRLPGLARWEKYAETPLYYASWRSLLRSLGSQENYRQEHGPRFIPDLVTRFLLFHPSTPRSVNCGVRRMSGYLKGMSVEGPGIIESRRIAGKFAAQLEFDQEAIMRPERLLNYIDESLANLYEIHDAVSNPLRSR